MRIRERFVKPVLIVTCEWSPDENPRYERITVSTIQQINDFELDAIYE